MAKAVAVLHGITPLMASSLRWRGPHDWEQFVCQQLRHTAARHQRILALLSRIDEISRAEAVAFVALKGSALHAMGLYACGQRPMADIDILVRESDASTMATLLQSLGYSQTFAIWKHGVFEPRRQASAGVSPDKIAFGENEHAAIKIELHTHIAEQLPISEADISELIFPRDYKPGLNPYPSNFALMLHLLLHAAGNIMPRSMRLIHLHDIALLAARLSSEEWQQLTQLRVAGRPMWWAVPPLRLVQRYYRHCVPEGVVKQLSPACPRALNRASAHQLLSDVSLTELGNRLFPALDWTKTLSEKLEYVRGRFHPGPEQRAILAMGRAESWAVNSGWSDMSRTRRALRGLLLRTPRPPPMYVVRAALAVSQHR